MIGMLFVVKRACSEQNAPLHDPHISGEVAEWLTKSPGAIWDAGAQRVRPQGEDQDGPNHKIAGSDFGRRSAVNAPAG